MNKNLILVFGLVLISACSYERTNKKLTSYGEDTPEWDQVESQAEIHSEELQQIEKRKELAEVAKQNHGLMHIHRFGPGFDVLLTLDAGDSDVSFTMKLPKQNAEFSNQAEDVAQAFEAQAEDQLEMLDEDKAELHEEELAARNEQMAQQKVQNFHEATKLILAAQSLFYKKQYWQSLDETNRALELVPDSAQAHALKGSIYYKMGLTDEAKGSWQQALDIDPSMDQVKASLARLK